MSDLKPMYEYVATITNVVDGDTVDVDIDLGFGIWIRDERLRLFGINAPEKTGPTADRGKASRDYLVHLLDQYGRTVRLRTEKTRDSTDKKGKYGRYLATLLGGPAKADLNKMLVAAGHAVVAYY